MGIYSREEKSFYIPSIGPTYRKYHDTIMHALHGRQLTLDAALHHLVTQGHVLTEVALLLVETLRTGHKVLVAGNGGSAAEAQHFVAELVGRFKRDRAPYAAISLTTDTSVLTAVANDYGFQEVFARQVDALGQPDDLLLVFSTSGESENVVRAALTGQRSLMKVVAITGEQPSRLERLADKTIHVLGNEAATVQELHMVITHILCEVAEAQLSFCEDAGDQMRASQALAEGVSFTDGV
jgi:D-sedoheptulose 7-phosphate isomerase